jgi:hypothetical protein
LPTSVSAATAARNMSPVLRCGIFMRSATMGACVPLPALRMEGREGGGSRGIHRLQLLLQQAASSKQQQAANSSKQQ